MTFFETWLWGVGFIALFAVVLCIIGTIADEWENIPRVLGAIKRRACNWRFDIQTVYYKNKQHRKNIYRNYYL